MESELYNILNSSTYQDDTERLNALVNPNNGYITTLLAHLNKLHQVLTDELVHLDELMDANADNPNSHHAKTMIYYGRKLSVRDALTGVDGNNAEDPDASPSLRFEPHVAPIQNPIDDLISKYDKGRYELIWECDDSYFSTPPLTKQLTQYHVLGKPVTMPYIETLDANGVPTAGHLPGEGEPESPNKDHKWYGDNTYVVRPGWVLNGWMIDHDYNRDKELKPDPDLDHPTTPFYLFDELGNDYKYKYVKQPDGSSNAEIILDTRIFGYNSDNFKLPYKLPEDFKVGGIPKPVNTTVHFILKTAPEWYTIKFPSKLDEAYKNDLHYSIGESSPAKITIRTHIGNSIVLPLTTGITLDTGYQIQKVVDETTYTNGCWTVVSPITGEPPAGYNGPLYFGAGATVEIGMDPASQLDPMVRTLFLKLEQVV